VRNIPMYEVNLRHTRTIMVTKFLLCGRNRVSQSNTVFAPTTPFTVARYVDPRRSICLHNKLPTKHGRQPENKASIASIHRTMDTGMLNITTWRYDHSSHHSYPLRRIKTHRRSNRCRGQHIPPVVIHTPKAKSEGTDYLSSQIFLGAPKG
jgi:hypothetical protein